MITSYLTKNLYINTIIVILIFILDRFSKIYVMNLDKVNYSSQLYQSKYLNRQKSGILTTSAGAEREHVPKS